MLFDFAIIFIAALALYWLFERVHLPGLLGMMLAGVLLGPQLIGFIDKEAMSDAGELRLAALIVILIRAGLGINRDILNKIGLPAALMGIVPGLVEGGAVLALAWGVFGFSLPEAGMLAFILAAVSPAIVVPQMMEFRDGGYGQKRHVPTLVLAGVSFDDVVAITMFGVFAGLATGEAAIATRLLHIPLSIGLGLVAGLTIGWLLVNLFQKVEMGGMRMALVFMVAAILLTEVEVRELAPMASLLAVMAIGFVILERDKSIATELSGVFAYIWIAAEVILFAALGAAVDIQAAASLDTLLMGLILIAGGLCARAFGVWLSLSLSSLLTLKEKVFCAIAYMPKATVQAAIGAVPLGMGVAKGAAILSVAVLSIVVTAPIGALAINYFGPRLLDRDDPDGADEAA